MAAMDGGMASVCGDMGGGNKKMLVAVGGKVLSAIYSNLFGVVECN